MLSQISIRREWLNDFSNIIDGELEDCMSSYEIQNVFLGGWTISINSYNYISIKRGNNCLRPSEIPNLWIYQSHWNSYWIALMDLVLVRNNGETERKLNINISSYMILHSISLSPWEIPCLYKFKTMCVSGYLIFFLPDFVMDWTSSSFLD